MRSELAVMAVCLLAACGPEDEPPAQMMPATQQPAPVAKFESVQQTLQTSCAFSSCHAGHGVMNAANLNLSTDMWLALVNVDAHNTKAAGEKLKLVTPCDPDHSFLFIKLQLGADATDPSSGYGGHMPAANTPLSQDELNAIHDWIARGALLSEPGDASGTTCRY